MISKKILEHTRDHGVYPVYVLKHQLDEADFCAGLQVSQALLQHGGEHTPHFSLASGITFIQQLYHADDALRLLDDKVHLQIELSPNQLHRHNLNVSHKWSQSQKKI